MSRSTIHAAVAVSAFGLSLLSLAGPALAGPFTDFAGRWRGGGKIALNDGSQEAIACRAKYNTDEAGNVLKINVACASDSYKVNLVSRVVARGGTFSGNWQETTRQLSGDVSGQIPSPGTMQASLDTVGGGLQLGARTDGRRQAITIRSQGSDIKAVDIVMNRK